MSVVCSSAVARSPWQSAGVSQQRLGTQRHALAGGPGLRGASNLRAALQRPQGRAASRTQLVVQANELNKWADRSNYDSHDDEDFEKATYDRDVANLVLRVLTAKATQRLILQLEELDLHKAQWLTNYVAEHPPGLGDKFLLELFKQPGLTVTEQMTGIDHKIDPANLAHRIIQIRSSMAAAMVQFPKFVEVQNTEVLRSHLTQSTFVSGSSAAGYKERRGYNRPSSRPPSRPSSRPSSHQT